LIDRRWRAWSDVDPPHSLAQLCEETVDQLVENRALRGKMQIERTPRDTRALDDVGDGDEVVSALGEELPRVPKDLPATFLAQLPRADASAISVPLFLPISMIGA
jgi:hypothetical protein